MTSVPVARAVIIPFGVPVEARGLGLGLAALFHGFSSIDGQSVGLAQLLSRPREDGTGPSGTGPVEAFIAPEAWRDLARGGPGLPDVSVVVCASIFLGS